IGRADIEIAGEERQIARPDLAHDGEVDPVEIAPPGLPIIGVFGQPDIFVRLEPDEFERSGADRMLALLRRRDVAGVDWRPARGEQRQYSRLGLLQVKADLEIAACRYLGDILVPALAWIDAQLVIA